MPTAEAHLRRAERNQQFADSVAKAFPDWEMVGYFYKAVHLVDCFASARHRRHFADHGERITFLQRDPVLRPLYADYRFLYDRSRDVRYECDCPTSDEICSDIIPRVGRIRRTVVDKLSAMKLLPTGSTGADRGGGPPCV